jgi:hypothetical protein
MDLFNDLYNRQDTLALTTIRIAIVVGVGGIGSWIALNLALSGKVNSLILIDDDLVESSNLNRTPFTIAQIGEYKVEALKYLILERRETNVITKRCKTSKKLMEELKASYVTQRVSELGGVICIDCRDQILQDLYNLGEIKYYKVGYDGTSVTIDGNPKDSVVLGSTSTGYRTIPSFICPSQLAANLVVSDILYHDSDLTPNKSDDPNYDSSLDDKGRLKKLVTFDTKDMLQLLTTTFGGN